MKKVTIHQPNYLPWLGFFSKAEQADCLILLDNADFTKNSVINRNKIRTNAGWSYLTIPIDRKYYGTKIQDVLLPADRKWMGNHWETLRHNYAKTDCFHFYQDFFEGLYHKNFEYLHQINEDIIYYLLDSFEIHIEVIKASELTVRPDLHSTDLLIALLKSVGAGIYLSGPSGSDYLDFQQFEQNNIALEFFKFQHPVYGQRYPGFESGMAAIDLLFNMGTKSSDIIKTSGQTSESRAER